MDRSETTGQLKKNTSFEELTKAICIPNNILTSRLRFIETKGYQLPLYAMTVQAGFPSSVDDDSKETIDLGNWLIQNPETTFLVRVSGESMINAHIFPNDILIVDSSIEPVHGKIVVVALDGQLTVKRLKKIANGKVFLMPENEHFLPIEVGPEHHLHLWGVVTAVIHVVK
jgi:DNA polymerase V